MIFRALAAKPAGRRDPGSMKYQRILDMRGRDAADSYAKRTAENAIAFVQANPPIKDRTDAMIRILELEALADSLPWMIYAGPCARRALEGAFTVAERVGGVSFGLSLREHAELVGQPLRVLRGHRDALLVLGWLSRNPGDRPGLTSRISLRTPTHIQSRVISECAYSVGPHRGALLAHDALAEWDCGWYLLHVVGVGSSERELAVRAGIDKDNEDLEHADV